MDIFFDKFRCFGEKQTARVAPITLLIGENSAGKSSFMAGLKYILDFTGSNTYPSFNKDPFYLGGFKSIAHYRGGKYGRASQFQIGISETFPASRLKKSQSELFDDIKSTDRTIQFVLTFTDIDGEAKPSAYNIQIKNLSIHIETNKGRVEALVQNKSENFEHTISTRQGPRFFTSRNDFLTLEYFLGKLSFVRPRDSETIKPADRQASDIVEELWRTFRKLSVRGSSLIHTLAPVRTQPFRNYDPTQLSQSSEGDQLIARLGRMARVDNARWKKVKESLESYGKITGLFETLKIQKLGTGESDPFRILVKKSGRQTNIIDVGYGVSQVLPFFIMLAELGPRSTLLIQQPEVHLHPSAQAALGDVISEKISSIRSPSFVIETHSDFIVDRIRLAVRKKKIKPSDVEILFFEKNNHNSKINRMKIDKNGEIIDPPESYRKFFLKESLSLLGL